MARPPSQAELAPPSSRSGRSLADSQQARAAAEEEARPGQRRNESPSVAACGQPEDERWLGAGLALAWRWWASSRGWSRPTGFCRCLASGATKARTEQRALSSGVQSARNKLLAASTATKAYRNYYYHHSDSPPNPGTQSPTSSGAAPQPPRQSPHTRGQLAGEKKLCWLPDELSKEHPR